MIAKKNYLPAVIGVGLVGALFWYLAPAYTKDKLIGLATFATDERQCFNFHKKDFLDPDSAYLESSYVWTKKDELEYSKDNPNPAFQKYEAMLRVKFHAKNRMGGYISDYLECPLINGHFDENSALLHSFDK